VQSQGANLGFCEPLTGWSERVESNASRISLSKYTYTQSSLENCQQNYKVSTLLKWNYNLPKGDSRNEEILKIWPPHPIDQPANSRVNTPSWAKDITICSWVGVQAIGLQGKVISKVFFFPLKSRKVSVVQWFYICIACTMLSALLPEVLNQYVTCNNWNFTRSAYIVNLNPKCRRTYLPVIGVLLLGRESSNRPWYTSSKGLFPTCWESHKKTPNIYISWNGKFGVKEQRNPDDFSHLCSNLQKISSVG
jgi:hypothetical protein